MTKLTQFGPRGRWRSYEGPLAMLATYVLCVVCGVLPTAAITCTDSDGDGYYVEVGCGSPLDCNDASPAVHPGAVDSCDGIDSDCDGLLDDGAGCPRACPGLGNGGMRLLVEPINNPGFGSLAWTGTVFGVAWHDVRSGFRQVYFARVGVDGHKIGSDVRISSGQTAFLTPSLAWSGSEFGVAWVDERDGNPELYFARLSPTGAKIGDDLRLTNDPSDLREPSLVWAGSQWAIAWSDARTGRYEVHFALVSAAGTRLTQDLRISQNSGLVPSLAWSGSQFGIAWQTDLFVTGEPQIEFARVNAAGTTVLGSITITNPLFSYAKVPALVWTGSEYGLAFHDQPLIDSEGIYFARIGAGGALLGSPQFIGFAPSANAPSVQWEGFEYAVAWSAFPNMRVVRVGASGAPIGQPISIPRSASNVGSLQWTGTFFGILGTVFSSPGNDLRFHRIGCNCVDLDQDGYSSCEDCSDASNQAWTPPGEPGALGFAPNKTDLSWSPPADLGGPPGTLRYDTLRSSVASDFETAADCVETAGADTSSYDPAVPAAGAARFYLVRAANLCAEPGFLGLTSAGAERVARTCP